VTRSPFKAGGVVCLAGFVYCGVGSGGRFARVGGGGFGEAANIAAASLECEGMTAGDGAADT
jgi:hypothetical protein